MHNVTKYIYTNEILLGSTTSTNRARKVSLASLPTTKGTKIMDAAARRRAISEVPKPSFQTENKPTNENTTQKLSPPIADDVLDARPDKPVEKPQLHETTECDCSNEHYATTVMDQVYSGTLESMYNLLYHSEFMRKFLLENQKSAGKIHAFYI